MDKKVYTHKDLDMSYECGRESVKNEIMRLNLRHIGSLPIRDGYRVILKYGNDLYSASCSMQSVGYAYIGDDGNQYIHTNADGWFDTSAILELLCPTISPIQKVDMIKREFEARKVCMEAGIELTPQTYHDEGKFIENMFNGNDVS